MIHNTRIKTREDALVALKFLEKDVTTTWEPDYHSEILKRIRKWLSANVPANTGSSPDTANNETNK